MPNNTTTEPLNQNNMGDMQFNGTPEEWEALVKKSKIMNKQTAVEWLMEQYNLGNGYERHLTESDFEQANKMFEEQIVNAWMATDNELQRLAAEQYYNETYKNK